MSSELFTVLSCSCLNLKFIENTSEKVFLSCLCTWRNIALARVILVSRTVQQDVSKTEAAEERQHPASHLTDTSLESRKEAKLFVHCRKD